ncbi:MAG TPA: DUF423 domain-containing protein [Casimicrobiaceae bacterium]|nr:DUF423 domain-containing protein [Casimicrobiaceae bacterium]
MSARLALVVGSLAVAAAVALGAFGAHALRARLGASEMAIWQTAVQYHAWHALGVLVVGLFLLHRADATLAGVAAWLLVAGIVLFSGSLYGLALSGIRGFGAVTPIGGVAFIVGWLVFAWAVWRSA